MSKLMNISGIDCYEKDGVAYLKLETVALGLDITKTDRKNGIEYKRVNRQALQKWLFSFGILNSENDELPDFIPENIFYRLAMKAKMKWLKLSRPRLPMKLFRLFAKPAVISLDKPSLSIHLKFRLVV